MGEFPQIVTNFPPDFGGLGENNGSMQRMRVVGRATWLRLHEAEASVGRSDNNIYKLSTYLRYQQYFVPKHPLFPRLDRQCSIY